MIMAAKKDASTDKNQLERGHTCTELTRCGIATDGRSVRLHFIDGDGQPAFLELLHDQAQSLVMTLPHLLTASLQTRTGDSSARYVFPLDQWTFELDDAATYILLTLRTTDGFTTCFSVAADTCQQMGAAMHSAADVVAAAVPKRALRN